MHILVVGWLNGRRGGGYGCWKGGSHGCGHGDWRGGRHGNGHGLEDGNSYHLAYQWDTIFRGRFCIFVINYNIYKNIYSLLKSGLSRLRQSAKSPDNYFLSFISKEPVLFNMVVAWWDHKVPHIIGCHCRVGQGLGWDSTVKQRNRWWKMMANWCRRISLHILFDSLSSAGSDFASFIKLKKST